jgi:threonine dehydrogenase-like Zn-dependent dehydrogenase
MIEPLGGAMRAAVVRGKQLTVRDVPEPVPGPGQVLVETIACGICGSDLHQLQHPDELVEAARLSGAPLLFDVEQDLVMGHEFCARVVDLGPDPGSSILQTGDVVVSMPTVVTPQGPALIGYSNHYPGGYAERMVLQAALCIKVPDGLDPRFAALTEPMAVGVHAVAKSAIKEGESAVVLGCGPVGLAVIAALRLVGVRRIVATDFSPLRRRLASHLGANLAVDPREELAIDAWRRVGGGIGPVIFEAVGVPGILDQAMKAAPRSSRLVVVGVCMETDTIWPLVGITKELTIQFAFGYDPQEFGRTLQLIAQGDIDVAPLITGEVGISGVTGAFRTLANPDEHAKILVEPALG